MRLTLFALMDLRLGLVLSNDRDLISVQELQKYHEIF